MLNDETRHVFDDKFWQSIDVAMNALDTTSARQFVSEKCQRFYK
jgi:hypothetical protein